MRKLIIPLLMSFALPAVAAQERQVIELQDNSKLTVHKDGTMEHIDSYGHRVRMKDGAVMVAKDGTTYMMKNNALWKALTTRGTLNPKQQ